MVVWVAERGGVGEHDDGVALLPEEPLAGPAGAGNELRDGAALQCQLSRQRHAQAMRFAYRRRSCRPETTTTLLLVLISGQRDFAP
jgi:hypothetical protein